MQPQPAHQELIYIFAAGRRLVQYLILALQPISNPLCGAAPHRVKSEQSKKVEVLLGVFSARSAAD